MNNTRTPDRSNRKGTGITRLITQTRKDIQKDNAYLQQLQHHKVFQQFHLNQNAVICLF